MTDVTDTVSLPATSSKIDSIHPFESDNFNVSVTIKGNSYHALLDTGAAVTASVLKFGTSIFVAKN